MFNRLLFEFIKLSVFLRLLELNKLLPEFIRLLLEELIRLLPVPIKLLLGPIKLLPGFIKLLLGLIRLLLLALASLKALEKSAKPSLLFGGAPKASAKSPNS